MRQYGKAAVDAVGLIQAGISPKKAWIQAISQYTKSEHSRKKVCPRNAFLGLCAAGMIVGVDSRHPELIGLKNDNGDYAIDAIKLLRQDNFLQQEIMSGKKISEEILDNWWKQIPNTPGTPQDQLHIVMALWQKGLIV